MCILTVRTILFPMLLVELVSYKNYKGILRRLLLVPVKIAEGFIGRNHNLLYCGQSCTWLFGTLVALNPS